jgi:hypothetical protein
MKLEETMKELELFNMRCDSDKIFRLRRISEARCVAINLSGWVKRRKRNVLKQTMRGRKAMARCVREIF